MPRQSCRWDPGCVDPTVGHGSGSTRGAQVPTSLQGVITGVVSSGYGLSAAFVTLLFSFFGEDPLAERRE